MGMITLFVAVTLIDMVAIQAEYFVEANSYNFSGILEMSRWGLDTFRPGSILDLDLLTHRFPRDISSQH